MASHQSKLNEEKRYTDLVLEHSLMDVYNRLLAF